MDGLSLHLADPLRLTVDPFFGAAPPESLLKQRNGLQFALVQDVGAAGVDGSHRAGAALDLSQQRAPLAEPSRFVTRTDELARAVARGDREAFAEFVLLHQRLTQQSVSWLQRVFCVDADDAGQICVLGLIKAVQKFDPDRGTEFSTYAIHWIRNACWSHGPDFVMPIRLKGNVRHVIGPFRREFAKLKSEFGAGRANDQLADWCARDAQFLPRWLAVDRAYNVRSHSEKPQREYFEARALPANVNDEPHQVALGKERVVRMGAAINRLHWRERRILRLRFGIEGQAQSIKSIAETMGLSRKYVYKLMCSGQKNLRAVIVRSFPDLLPEGARSIAMTKTFRKRSDRSHPRAKGESARRHDQSA